MLGLFSRFGRSRDLRLLDEAMRTTGMAPVLIPDAVKFTVLKLLKRTQGVTPETCAQAAALLGYCTFGPDGVASANEVAETERRIERAIEAGDSLDAQLVLLCLEAGMANAAVIERYQLESGREA